MLLVNYKGRPWMKGISENHPLFLSVFACVAGCAVCAWGAFPQVKLLRTGPLLCSPRHIHLARSLL